MKTLYCNGFVNTINLLHLICVLQQKTVEQNQQQKKRVSCTLSIACTLAEIEKRTLREKRREKNVNKSHFISTLI